MHNEVTNTSANAVVQAGTVRGGVHLHVHDPVVERVVPLQLPALPVLFAGRAGELARLERTFGAAGWSSADGTTAMPESGMVIGVICGAGGVGKTWLALRWAHDHLDQFPDGQLFVDLRGFSPDGPPMGSSVAVRGFLDALGVSAGHLPVDSHAQAALFRSIAARKRMLLILDNAADVNQVVPLLPGGSTCTVLVTTRRRLPSLVVRHGAHHLNLDVLSDAEARDVLVNRLGLGRLAREPEAVDSLIGSCKGYPLALSVVAGRAHAEPHRHLATFAEELRESGLGAFGDDDPEVSLPTVLSWSYRALSAEQAMLFRLLGIAPGPDISLLAVASLADLPVTQARTVLRALEHASLLQQDGTGRCRMHDLVRRYATDLADNEMAAAARDAALRRVSSFYLHTVYAAQQMLDPYRELVEPDPPVPGSHPYLPR